MPPLRPLTKPESAEAMRQTRQNLAATEQWPEGTLDNCDKLALRFPGWLIWFQSERTVGGRCHAAVYVASRWTVHDGHRQFQASDPDGLTALIEAHDYPPPPAS
ncbi:hypothetical protein Ait01nite_019890 [Actinoplanes italicus]|uniref:Uncharacterized protein n=1 Tax=Actinoplanes italicus TaxID=113567 RepID=A0A2T0KPF5_9ACTN|nr:hypothetical protein [Actinoplanes italicus]PRX25610.1 hypothetical protein CLV67_101327 [Actinoplanes italicus]GIE28944.1 hypothetical protein Ait01nite_019890 [Actinoplanes italicus]